MVTCNNCYHYEACKKIFQIAFKDFTNYIFVKGCELYKSTADVAEVKHGEWATIEIDKRKRTRLVECTECNCVMELDSIVFGIYYNYCPCCGAKMDGKDDA